jgi:hypothetical protein
MRTGGASSDTYGAPRSRCPACNDWATEGEDHWCPTGPDRTPHKNPQEDEE